MEISGKAGLGGGVVDLDRDLIEARVRGRHAGALGSWGLRRWIAERRVQKEIDVEVSAAHVREARRKTQTKHLF